MNVIEALIVVGLVTMGVTIVANINMTSIGLEEEAYVDQGHIESWADTMLMKESTNTSVHFGSYMEQLLVEAYEGERDPFRVLLYRYFHTGVEGMSYLETDYGGLTMYQGAYNPGAPVAASNDLFNPEWGITSIQPGVTPVAPGQPVDLTLTPFWGLRVPHYEGEVHHVRLEGTHDGDPVTMTLTGNHRLSQLGVGDDPPVFTFVDEFEAPVSSQTTAVLGEKDTNRTWEVRMKITPGVLGNKSDFISTGEAYHVSPPTGWGNLSIEEDGQWRVQWRDPEHVGLSYTGPSRDSAGEAWLNFTLEQPLARPLAPVGVLQVEATTAHASRAHLALHDPFAVEDLKPWVSLDRPDPVPLSPVPWRILVHNPTSDTLVVQDVTIVFEKSSHLFLDETYMGTDWSLTIDGANGTAVLSTTKDLTVAPHTSKAYTVPVASTRHAEHAYVRHHGHPSLLVDDENFAVHPLGRPGTHTVSLPGLLPGLHSLQVPYNVSSEVAPGRLDVTVLADPVPALEDIQDAHRTMHLGVEPYMMPRTGTATVTFDTGHLLKTLRSLQDVDPDSVKVRLNVSDSLGKIVGKPHTSVEHPLLLERGPAVVGFGWIHANSDGVEDLIVAYANGHMVALDGVLLPDLKIWDIDLGDEITSAPVVMDIDSDGEDEIVVGVKEGAVNWLKIIGARGDTERKAPSLGRVAELSARDCGPGVRFVSYLLEGNKWPFSGDTHSEPDGIDDLSPRPATFTWDTGIQTGSTAKAGALAVTLQEGRFAPFGACDMVLGVSTGQVIRYNGTTLEERWRIGDHGDPLKGLWLEDTHNTTLEKWTESSGVEVLAAWSDRGYQVIDGVQPMLGRDWYVPDNVTLLPGDVFVGLSWVDGQTGYLASEMGWIWKTEDGGETWGSEVEVPITQGGKIIDFVFGGNGHGLFVRDDNTFAKWPGVVSWRHPTLQDSKLLGLTETEHGPGIITTLSKEKETSVRIWDFGNARPGTSLINISCSCSGAHFNGGGLGGWSESGVWVNGSRTWSNTTISPTHGALSASLNLVFVQEGEVQVHNGERAISYPAHNSISFKNSTRSHREGGLVTDSGVVRFDGGTPAFLQSSEIVVNRASGGPGPVWLVNSTKLLPLNGNPQAYSFLVNMTGSVLEIVEDDWPQETAFRIETMSEEQNLVPGEPFEVGPGDHIVHVTASNADEFPELVLRVDGVSIERSSDFKCLDCIVAVESHSLDSMWNRSLPVLPLTKPAFYESVPVLASDGAKSWLFTADTLEEVLTHDPRTGLVKAKASPYAIGDHEVVVLKHATVPHSPDTVWLETGMKSDPALTGSGSRRVTLPERLPGDYSALPNYHRIDVASGMFLCSGEFVDSGSIKARKAIALGTSGSAVLGSDLGRLTLLTDQSCDKRWSKTPLETGRIVEYDVRFPGNTFDGVQFVDIVV
ncbi:MAG: hypothetical protein KY455_09070 [Euryarchaeota archaeon]|nr:hypothetical protein [Euryarchaeota archaeon]